MNGHTWQTKFSHSFTFWARRPNQPDKSNSSFPFTVNREPSNRGVIIPFFVLKCLSSYIQHTDFRVRVCVCVRTFTNCQKYRNRPSTALIENNAKIQVCGVCVCGRERREPVRVPIYSWLFDISRVNVILLRLFFCVVHYWFDRDGLAVVVKSVHFESAMSCPAV